MTGEYTFPIRDTSVGLTAYRTGDNYGQAVSTAVQQSGDPANYVNLVDDGTDLANDGTTTNIQYNDNLIAEGQPVDVSNQNLVHITLKQVQPEPGQSLSGGQVQIVLSNPESARLFDKNGNLLTDLTATQSDGSYLAGLFSGNVDIYVEGLQADSDFSITYSYADASGTTQATTSIHLAIADLTATNSDGTAVSSLDTDEDMLLDLPAPSNSVSLAEAYGSADADAYRVQIAGLQTSQVQSLIVSSNVGDQFQDSLTATAGGVESSLPFVLADNGGQPLTAAQQSQILSTYDVNAIDPEPGLNGVTLRLKTGSDSFSRKVGEVTPVVIWVDTAKMPKGFDLQANQATINQMMSSAGFTSPVILLPMTYVGSAGTIGKLTGQGYQYYLGPTGGLVQVSSASLQQQLKAAAQQQQAIQQAREAILAHAQYQFAQSHLTPTFQDRVEEFQSLYGYYITHPFSGNTPAICKAGNAVAYLMTGAGLAGLAIVAAAPTAATVGGAALVGEGAAITGETTVVAEEVLAEGVLTTEAAAAAGSLGVGSTAVVAPGLGAGTYPALLINGTVYVARFHVLASELAGGISAVRRSFKSTEWQ